MTQHRWSQATRRHPKADPDTRGHENHHPWATTNNSATPVGGITADGLPADGTLLDVIPLPETGKVIMIVAHVVPAAAVRPGEMPSERGRVVRGVRGQVAPAPEAGGGSAAGSLRVDRSSRRVWVDGREVRLTYQEFELLDHLTAHPWTVFSRAELMATLWPGVEGATRTVDVHVHRLRRKLGREGRHLGTVRRVGYVYRPQNTGPAAPETRPAPSPTSLQRRPLETAAQAKPRSQDR
jgi:DNA-binding winged helix-turn-helix (wHTH) protein